MRPSFSVGECATIRVMAQDVCSHTSKSVMHLETASGLVLDLFVADYQAALMGCKVGKRQRFMQWLDARAETGIAPALRNKVAEL